MSDCEYYEESGGDYSSEEEISDIEIEAGFSESEVEYQAMGQQEIIESSCTSSSENAEDNQPKLTDIIKTQQVIIESLRKELASVKLQSISNLGNKKCATRSEESTSAVVSSFEDDDDELDSLSSEELNVSNSSGYGAPAKNPMLIDVVIQNVMEHLPLKSLLVARLVCRKWNAMAASNISNNCGPILLEVHQPWKPRKGIKVSTYIDVMRNTLCCPISKYSISSFTALEELDRFFFHFGRNVKHLDLNFPEEFDDSHEFARLLTRTIPHVESIRTGCCRMFKDNDFIAGLNVDPVTSLPCKKEVMLKNLKAFCIGNIVNMIPSKTWLEQFFKMTPNMEKLVLHVNFKENGNTFIRMVLEALLNLEVLHKIKSLMISCLTESHLRTLMKLADCGLRLRHFRFQDLCIHLTEISGATLEAFLNSQAENLEGLEIDQSSNFPRIRHFQLPPMKSLKSLSIISSQRISFGTVNYKSDFPKLEKMILRGYDVFNCNSLFPHSDSVLKRAVLTGHCLKVLSLPSKFSVPHFPRILSRMFPNIKDLEVRSVTNECLREIWESWPALSKFKLVVSHFDDNIDSGMTGIPEETCGEIRGTNNLSERSLDEFKVAPGLTDMISLRSLELECRAMWIPCQLITDITGYFALAQLKNLRHLKVTEIGVPEKFDLSNECIMEIIKALKDADTSFKIMDDHGRWQLELGRIDLLRNTYESEPQLEDHNKDREFLLD